MSTRTTIKRKCTAESSENVADQRKTFPQNLFDENYQFGRAAVTLLDMPREFFLGRSDNISTYDRGAIVTEKDPTGLPLVSSTAPGVMLSMLHALDVRPGERILEVGTGTGYNAAVLASLVGSRGWITTLEVTPLIAHAAEARFRCLDLRNIEVAIGDVRTWQPERNIFDKIIITCDLPGVPPAIFRCLRSGGRLVCPSGFLYRLEKHGNSLVGVPFADSSFVSARPAPPGIPIWRAVKTLPGYPDTSVSAYALPDIELAPLTEAAFGHIGVRRPAPQRLTAQTLQSWHHFVCIRSNGAYVKLQVIAPDPAACLAGFGLVRAEDGAFNFVWTTPNSTNTRQRPTVGTSPNGGLPAWEESLMRWNSLGRPTLSHQQVCFHFDDQFEVFRPRLVEDLGV